MVSPSIRLNNIPPLWSSFVGRSNERSQVKDFLENSRDAILFVYGQRGVGKSSLVCSVANELKDKFSSVVWLDRSNALELFEKLSTYDNSFAASNDKVEVEELTAVGQKIIERLRQKNETINSEIVEVAYRALVALPRQGLVLPFLLVVDDFDEEYSLGSAKGTDFALCDYIEQFVQSPNKLILTSRLHENCFRGLGYETLEIGLLQQQDVDSLVKRYMRSLDSTVLVNNGLDDTSAYIWNISGGLAEFISRNIIPITIHDELLLERDPESIKAIQAFAQCYLLEREQPTRLDGYKVLLEPKALADRLVELFNQDDFTEFVLWKWLNLELTESYSETELGIALGLNTLDNQIAAKLHSSLRELHRTRFIARQIYLSQENKLQSSTKLTKWILLPVISSYLKEYWPNTHQHWSMEAFNLCEFVGAYLDQPDRLESHYKRIFDVISWCYSNQDWGNLVSLGVSVAKVVGRLIETDNLPRSTITYDILVDICRKTAEVLEQQQDSESWRPLIYILLILAKLYSSAKVESNQLLFKKAREYAIKALTLAEDNKASEEIDAKVLTAKLHLYVGELDKAEVLLLQVYSDKKAIKSDWAVTAYLLATILRREHGCDRSLAWYERITDSISQHLKIDISLQSAVDAARFCSDSVPNPDETVPEILMKATHFVKNNSEYIKRFPLLSVQVIAYSAATYEKLKEFEKYKGLLQDAKQICKDCGLEQHPIYEGLNNRLVYLSQQELGTSLFEDLTVSADEESDTLYGFDEFLSKCPICRKRLLSNLEIVSCSSCNSSYHKDCLVQADLQLCPICHENLKLEE